MFYTIAFASHKHWTFDITARSNHLMSVLFEPHILNKELPKSQGLLLMQHHFMQSLLLNLKIGKGLESDNDDADADGNIVPIQKFSRQDSGLDLESILP
ncbi:hypothetical protein OnM2_074027 [Erysiphe neolycopersici]|nr:hypothetical protein OnM2_074027 [Erysiphe neolycopersici]